MTRIYQLPCIKSGCGSSDAVTVYEDGTAFCYSCRGYYHAGDYPLDNITNKGKKLTTKDKTKPLKVLPEEFNDIPDRGLSADTCKKYGIRSTATKHAYPFTRKGKHANTQWRKVNPEPDENKFYWELSGSLDGLELFGQTAFPAGGKSITICEGALDAASAYQMFGSQWPFVAVHSAVDAEKAVRANLDYLNTFEKIVLCLDADKNGMEAAERCARVLPVGKVRIVKLQHGKDPNEYLTKGLTEKFKKEWYQGADWTPTGLKLGSEMFDEILNAPNLKGVSWPWDTIQHQTYGIKKSQFIVIHAPTGVGKSTILNEVEYKIIRDHPEAKIGLLRLEETNRDSAIGIMSCHANKRLNLPDVWEAQKEADLRRWFDETINSDRVVIYDHFGSTHIDDVLNKIRYMHAMGCDYIFLDHLSIVVSDQSGDERKQLDELSTKAKQLCMELDIALVAVIHENRNGEIRGTAGVEQLANFVIRASRELKSADPWRRNIIKLELVKNRFKGETGPSTYLTFEEDTGRLKELSNVDIQKYENEFTFD